MTAIIPNDDFQPLDGMPQTIHLEINEPWGFRKPVCLPPTIAIIHVASYPKM